MRKKLGCKCKFQLNLHFCVHIIEYNLEHFNYYIFKQMACDQEYL